MKKPYRDLATRIRQEMATAQNVDFLRSLPTFKVLPKLPQKIRDLLQRLHDVENSRKPRSLSRRRG
ncbi:hypothetical protein CO676_23120 [Sinorhizobium sp. BJ1]|nr:hypothetical protein CO676_23120 [Sinorhizobium sp. BJ1]